jgi:hypothetical protein
VGTGRHVLLFRPVPQRTSVIAFYWILAWTALAFSEGDINSPGGWAVFGLAGVTTAGLVVVAVRARRARPTLDAGWTFLYNRHRWAGTGLVSRDSWGDFMRHLRMPSGRAFIGARLRRSLLVCVGVAAISLALAPGALANTTIGNTPPWTPASGITNGFGWYGPPYYQVPTLGETVTVPPTDTALDSFTLYVDLPTTLTFRGEVYAWDNTLQHATGNALYESGQMQTTSYGSGFAIQPITFNTGGIPLTAGKQYVLFITTARDTPSPVPYNPYYGFYGTTVTDTYTGGDFWQLPGTNDSTAWTTTPWTISTGYIDDLGFTASFSSPLPTSKAQCMNGGWKNFGTTFKNQGDCVSFVASGGKNPPSGP